MLMYTLATTSDVLWHPIQYVGIFIMAVALLCLLCSKKNDD
jgi:hypothetical protein